MLNCVKKPIRTLSRKKAKNILDHELRDSQSTFEKLSLEMPEVQEVINSLGESQDFKDLETASGSGSAHAPGKPSVFPRCSSFASRDHWHHFNTRD